MCVCDDQQVYCCCALYATGGGVEQQVHCAVCVRGTCLLQGFIGRVDNYLTDMGTVIRASEVGIRGKVY